MRSGARLGRGDALRRFASSDHGAGDADLLEATIEQTYHLAIAGAGRRTAHYDADQTVSVAHRRGGEIET